ncbi:MAG: hypothetical protein IJW00_04705 [Clostridia bacterium]|nr:hypothetical protein [Clostridia bacterium]
MGRSLGYFDSDELDRPELNKCPECECYFASEECPLCGKVCPEHMRAGNRAPVKKPKKTRNSSGRVQFIPWYHTWWFILIMMFFMPVVGVVLFFTSPYSKKVKIIGAVIGVIYVLAYVFMFYLGGINMIFKLMLGEYDLVNDDISREAYIETCEDLSVEEFYRISDDDGVYITIELKVLERHVDLSLYGDEQNVYYLCTDETGEILIYVRDCSLDNAGNYLKGDTIRVWGQNAGEQRIYPEGQTPQSHPCLNMAYSERVN